MVFLFKLFDQFSKPCLIVDFSLTPPIKPLIKQVSQLIFKAAADSPSPCQTLVVIVANQLPVQFSKQYLLKFTFDRLYATKLDQVFAFLVPNRERRID